MKDTHQADSRLGTREDTIWTAPKMTVMIQDYMSVR